MILRSFAALAFTAGAVIVIAVASVLGRAPGIPPELAHLRAMKDRAGAPPSYRPVTLDSLAALPHGRTLDDYAALENQGVVLTGWVQTTMLASDGDVHLEVVTRAPGPDGRDSTYATAEITPAWREGSPGWRYDSLLVAFRPNRGGPTPWDAGPRRVRVSGWLTYDYQYDNLPPSWALQHGAPRRTGWEIHPVTRIELWNEADSAWTELRR